MTHPDALGRLTPSLPEELLASALDLVAPIWDTLDSESAEDLAEIEPAVRFDPVAAAGRAVSVRALPAPPPMAPPEPPEIVEELIWTSLADLAALVRAGTISTTELVEAFATRIAAFEPRLNAFITPTLDDARSAAQSATSGALAGVPIGLKDLIDTAGIRTTCGSRIFGERVPERDAICWIRLKSAGAVLLGKLNTHEFAAGATNENPAFGDAHNPWNTARVTGGSSGGSGAAVAAALVSAALGTDTGGSIRIPAACCGVVGLKPTYGTVSTAGVQPLAWSLDHVGPLARSVHDAALLVDVLTDRTGSQTCDAAARAGAAHGMASMRIGVPYGWIRDDIQPAVRDAFENALSQMRQLGAETVEVAMPDARELSLVNRAIAYAEASTWHEHLLRERAGEYGANVRPRQEAGRFILASQYLKAQRLRTRFCRMVARMWQHVDLIATPTLPITAPPIGTRRITFPGGRTEGTQAALIRFVAPINLLGIPALTVPCGFDPEGLPVGLQFIAPAGAEALLCYVGAAYEAATPWHTMRPPLGG